MYIYNILLGNIRVFDAIKVEEISSVNGYFVTANSTTNHKLPSTVESR